MHTHYKVFSFLGSMLVAMLGACDVSSGFDEDAGRADGSVLRDGDTRDARVGDDTDGDTVSDVHEGGGSLDTDGDGIPDTEDEDSDGDGYTDREEAGDDDPSTPPIDTDRDTIPDLRDLDSDGDGLPDASERTRGTDPRSADTDGDGVDDLVEIVAGTDPTDPTDDPRSRGDFFFVVPYMETPTPERDTLEFEAAIQKADVLFLIDTSASMQPYIDNIANNLRDTIVPALRGTIPDIWFGVGQFDVLPEDAALNPSCVGIRSDLSSTGDSASVEAALRGLTTPCAGYEPYAQALWLWATGDHARWDTVADPGCAAGRIGLGCARNDALPIVVLIGDEDYGQSYRRADAGVGFAPDLEMLVAAYRAISARVIVLGPTVVASDVGRTVPDRNYRALATRTSSVDASGAPLLFPDASFSSISTDLIDAITRLANGTTLDVSPRARDRDDDGVDATEFIDRIEANATAGGACATGLMVEDRDGDGVLETFVRVPGATTVCFDIVPRVNTIVEPSDAAQVFRASIDVVGDGITVLDSRDVFFLVPPRPDTPSPI